MPHALNEFADQVNEIMPVVAREFWKKQGNDLEKNKITIPQLLILNFLAKRGESKMGDLAHFMEVTTAAMTGIVDRLVRSGYVVRLPQTEDRRIIKIGLSSKGEQLIKRVNLDKRQMIINIFGKISQGEREEYLKILMHIHSILSKEKQEAAQ
jgi:DNA-binding MarR family transcriptional regulator